MDWHPRSGAPHFQFPEIWPKDSAATIIKDKLNFYYASRGSLTETKSHIIYGQAVGYFKPTESDIVIGLTDEIWKELNALIRSLRRTTQP